MKSKFNIDKYVCVNMDRRLDRWVECVKEFEKAGIDVERIPGGPYLKFGKLPTGKNRDGLIETNRKIFNKYHQMDHTLCIFEDDVTFTCSGLTEKIAAMKLETQLPDNWGFILMGGHLFGSRKTRQCSKDLLSVNIPDFKQRQYIGGTHAVIYSSRAVKIMASLTEDIFYRTPYVDVYIQEILTRDYNLPCFCLYPMIAYQREDFSDIEGRYTRREPIKKMNTTKIEVLR